MLPCDGLRARTLAVFDGFDDGAMMFERDDSRRAFQSFLIAEDEGAGRGEWESNRGIDGALQHGALREPPQLTVKTAVDFQVADEVIEAGGDDGFSIAAIAAEPR